MSETNNEKVMTVKPSRFEKINVIVANVSILILMGLVFWVLGVSSNWFSKKNKELDESIKRSERMHKEYIDTIKASTSNIVEAIKSTNK
jgi:heme/copper-type cytochrome/quinol oxidase subunit 1